MGAPVTRIRTASSAVLVRLLKAIFYPVACICMRHGMSERQAAEILRWCFVKAAMGETDFAMKGRNVHRQTISHVAVQTGLTRMEALKYARQAEPELDRIVWSTDRASRVLSAWYSDPRYHDSNGKPADLPMRGLAGSFQALAAEWGRDTPPRSIADVLVSAGCAEWLHGKHKVLRFVSKVYRGPDNTAEEAEVLCGFAADFAHSLQEKLRSNTDLVPRFRKAYFLDIPRARAMEVREHLNEALARFNRECESLLDTYRDANHDGDVMRIGVGSYTFYGSGERY